MSALDSSRTDSAKARDLGPHPWRSLVLSACVHLAFLALLSMLPSAPRAAATRMRRASTATIEVQVARARAPIAWPVETEPLEEVREPALDVDLPDEVVDTQLPAELWFDEPPPFAVPRGAPISAAEPIFADLPEDLFAAPAPPEVVEPVAPEEAPPEDVAEPSPDVVPAPEAPLEPEPTSEDESPSAPAPDVAGDPTDEAPEDAEGEQDEDAPDDGGGDAESHLLDAPPPRYPASARRMGKEGVVQLEIDVDREGRVVAVRIHESSGHRILDEAARQCVLDQWRFRPREEGGGVETYVHSIGFEIR